MSRARFGRFEFDAATGELWLDGRRVRLQRQPSRLLELLLARPGDVVSREEIRLALWGEDTHVDFERSLNFCVAKLRSALRDNAGLAAVTSRRCRRAATVSSRRSRRRRASHRHRHPRPVPRRRASCLSGSRAIRGGCGSPPPPPFC